MLRLFLRLYLLLALGFAAAIFVVDHVIDAFYDSIVENYHRDAVRGQAYSLVEKLAPLDQAGRQRQLEDWRPHYGLELSLTDARQAKLTQEEQALLDKNLLVVREDFTEFISRIDAGPQLLDIKLPPEPSLTPLFTVPAYILLGVLVGIALLVWVRPHWRDLGPCAWPRNASATATCHRARAFSDAPTSAPWPSTSTRWPTASKA